MLPDFDEPTNDKMVSRMTKGRQEPLSEIVDLLRKLPPLFYELLNRKSPTTVSVTPEIKVSPPQVSVTVEAPPRLKKTVHCAIERDSSGELKTIKFTEQ